MAIVTILEQKVDIRKNGTDCDFNGYLEDYLSLQEDSTIDPFTKGTLTSLLEKEPDLKICVNLRTDINANAISNQIIRYKDVFKLSNKAMVYPYLLYMNKDGQERALLIVPFEPYSFIYAKGYYYCMTEPGSPFIECKNEIVALSTDHEEVILDTWEKIFHLKAGALQRNLDHRYYSDYETLKKDAITAATTLKEEAPDQLAVLSGDERQNAIYAYIIKWFLLKKVLYVQYMVNKTILNSVHEGNVRKQRNQAKLNADEISFLSFSEMWRMSRQKDQEVEADS